MKVGSDLAVASLRQPGLHQSTDLVEGLPGPRAVLADRSPMRASQADVRVDPEDG